MHRGIKSFVLRAGRVSARQQQALDQGLTAYLLPPPGEPWCLATLFGRTAETVVEIGFGMGRSLVEMAKAAPLVNFIGIEVHQAGIGALVASLRDEGISNVRIAPYDAIEVFYTCLPKESLLGVQIFFPDPWPKKRHHKRRLIQSDFIQWVIQAIKIGGTIHCATDWEEYAHTIHSVLSAASELQNQDPAGGFVSRPLTRPLTKFEERGQRLGHGVWDLIFIKKGVYSPD